MFVVQIEGNIGIGKSTFINYVKQRFKNSKNLNVEFIDESILDWMNVENNNLLNLYYNNPEKYGEIFQFYVFITTLRKCLKENYKNIDIIFMERSLYTSIHCFNKLLLDEKFVDLISHKVLKKSLEIFSDIILQPDVIIYFEIDNKDIPLLLKNRIVKRKRQGESNISNDYLIKLNNIYNNVINNDYSKKTKIIKYKCNDHFLNITPNSDNSDNNFNNDVIKFFSQIFTDIFLLYTAKSEFSNVSHFEQFGIRQENLKKFYFLPQ